jgi:PUA domain protein
MSKELRIRRRARLRGKEASALSAQLVSAIGVGIDAGLAIDSGDYDKTKVYIAQGRILAFESDGKAVPSLRLLLANPPSAKHVTVDMGAVKFLCNGADIMGPGVVGSDEGIAAGDIVWVREESHGKPLAVGVALVRGAEMVRGKGKVIRSLHYVGDSLWEFED